MIKETCIIYPTSRHTCPSPPLAIPLHGLDLLGPPMDIHNHRFYHSPGCSFTVITDKLKSSLSEALELYPPVAGTVKTKENGEVYISTEAIGTPFTTEVIDAPYVCDFERLSPRNTLPIPLLSPSLAVKVTKFSCGVVVVASSINHQITDLCGYLDFLKLWSKLARGEAADFTKIPTSWFHNPGRFFSEADNYTSGNPPPPFEVHSAPLTGPQALLLATSNFTRWKITKSSLQRLKQDLSPSAPEKWISSGDALVAIISGAITRARESKKVKRLEGRSPEESQIEAISMAADGRERAPEGNMAEGQYFGNFNVLLSSEVCRSDLLSSTNEAASRVALAIRNTLNAELSPEAVKSKISFFEDPKNIEPPGRISWTVDVIFTNWCKFDLKSKDYDLGWGKPFLATDGAGCIFPPGYCLLTKDYDTSDIFMLITVEEEAADKLIRDLMLNVYAEREPNQSYKV
ncbi:hypothetical protein INT47_002662 [Mucor saturninus]|uniref:Transferase n=1 Tax=Mucor saturninus TaxID=64648 RepID=A0A8H7QLK8_9FUNG|nr:hypothetical protein INT47_002662 [Mucor saturninus]